MKKPYTRIVQMIIEADTVSDLDKVREELKGEYQEHSSSTLKGMYLQRYDVEQLLQLIAKVEILFRFGGNNEDRVQDGNS